MLPSPFHRVRVRTLSLTSICIIFVAIALVWTSRQRAAATITVNSLTDVTNPSDGLCTLREAITAANNNAASGAVAGECGAGSSSGSDVIDLTGITGTINLSSQLPNVGSNITIMGPGSSQLTVRRDTGGVYRIFSITDLGTFTVSGLTIANGRAPDGSSPSDGGNGGGIQNGAGTLTLNDVTVTGNSAGGGVFGAFGGVGGHGGGIYSSGSLTITNSSITNNAAGRGGNGNINPGNGGSGGGIMFVPSGSFTLALTNCTVSGNTGGRGGDDIGSTGGDGGNGGGIYVDGNANLTNVTLSNNAGGDSVSHGIGGNGGAIFVVGGRTATILNSTLDTNRTGNNDPTFGTRGKGGAIDVEINANLFLRRSAVTNNTAIGPGGGIRNRQGVARVENSTFSGNTAAGGGSGIDNSEGTTTITSCTITNNTGGNAGGVTTFGPTPLIRNTIIAGNTFDLTGGPFNSGGHNLIGKSDGTQNFTNGSNGDQVGTLGSPIDPQLGPLANNGGPTATHALLANSPAIDAGDNCVTEAAHCNDPNTPQLTTDQRGFTRIINGTIDIGAYELGTILVTNTSDSGAGSLRQAIADANASPAALAIVFNIPSGDPGCSGGVCTITLTTGELDISNSVTIQGPGANLLTVSANNSGRILTVQSGTATISGLTVANGNAAGPGGGGIMNDGATLNFSNGAILASSGSGGGGLLMTAGTTNITGCLIANNTAANSGGGIWIQSGNATIRNTTISGNVAPNNGGGFLIGGGSATLTNVTITNNRAFTGAGGGLRVISPGAVTLQNSIVAANFSGAFPSTVTSDIAGTVTGSFNLIGNGGSGGLTNGLNNNIVGVANPGLAALANNGGTMQTHALLAGSPALDAGDNTLANDAGLTTDQRGAGFSRMIDGPDGDTTATVDIGAFEAQVSVEDISDKTTNEDTQLQFNFNLGGTISSVTATSSNTGLVPNNAANISVTSSGSNRTLTINPVTNQFGTSTITVTANGSAGANMTDTFVLTVNSADDPPSFTKGADQTVLEDSGAQSVTNWATNISPGPSDESGQTVSFTVVNNNNALFSSQPAVSSSGTLTYTPAPNANGSAAVTVTAKDDGGTANGGNDTSASQSFTINVTAVNDAPSFTKGGDQTVNEDAGAQSVTNWATAISRGAADESGQTLTFQVNNNTNSSLFSAGPAVSSTGTLTYTAAANANGSATITINVKDNGGTANGGVDTSASQTFVITVTAVNDAPSFIKGPNQTVNEDASAQTVNTWATGLSAGPADESGQTFTFQVTSNTNASLFSAGPAISSNGTLSYTPAANANGSATITINLKDSGGTANGGVDTSASQSFTITVTAVNDAPSFTKGADQTVNNNAGAQSVANWATNISAGPANESGQTLTFQVTGNTNPGLFAAGPAVSSAGTLTYNPSTSGGGTATITINLKDNGGTANSGVDTSPTQTFTITVTPVGGFVSFASSSSNTTENSGSTTVNVVRTGDTSRAISVNYATNGDSGLPCSTANGIASPKCDFTAALGKLNFAAGETSKPITILLSQDSFVEGPETITMTLSSPAGGSALGTPGSMSIAIADDATEPSTNIIDDAGMFVRMHYHDFLNREADQSGLDFWTGQMTNCGSSDLTVCRVNVSGAFFLSIEFQQTGYLVERMYKTAYGDATATSSLGGSHQVLVPVVRANEFLADTQRIGRGVIVLQPGWEQVLENNKQAYALEFVQTARFISALPTTMSPAQFVDKLNQNAGNVLSPSERTTAINSFGIAADTTNVNTRAQVLRQVAEDTDLFNAEFNRAFVLTEFIGYLRRNPNDAPDTDYTGYEFWLSKLNQFNGDYIGAEMVKAFISSSEYRQRFGP